MSFIIAKLIYILSFEKFVDHAVLQAQQPWRFGNSLLHIQEGQGLNAVQNFKFLGLYFWVFPLLIYMLVLADLFLVEVRIVED